MFERKHISIRTCCCCCCCYSKVVVLLLLPLLLFAVWSTLVKINSAHPPRQKNSTKKTTRPMVLCSQLQNVLVMSPENKLKRKVNGSKYKTSIPQSLQVRWSYRKLAINHTETWKDSEWERETKASQAPVFSNKWSFVKARKELEGIWQTASSTLHLKRFWKVTASFHNASSLKYLAQLWYITKTATYSSPSQPRLHQRFSPVVFTSPVPQSVPVKRRTEMLSKIFRPTWPQYQAVFRRRNFGETLWCRSWKF